MLASAVLVLLCTALATAAGGAPPPAARSQSGVFTAEIAGAVTNPLAQRAWNTLSGGGAVPEPPQHTAPPARGGLLGPAATAAAAAAAAGNNCRNWHSAEILDFPYNITADHGYRCVPGSGPL